MTDRSELFENTPVPSMKDAEPLDLAALFFQARNVESGGEIEYPSARANVFRVGDVRRRSVEHRGALFFNHYAVEGRDVA